MKLKRQNIRCYSGRDRLLLSNKRRALGLSPLAVQEVASAYNFPSLGQQSAVSAAIVELGGYADKTIVAQYCERYGLPAPQLIDVFLDGATATPDGADGADGEVCLDQQIIAAIAPGIPITTIYAANSVEGFADAISYAATKMSPVPTALSISWGAPESGWEAAAIALLEKALLAALEAFIATFVAAGDSGSSDGAWDGTPHVDYPASSPSVIACGGTQLILTKANVRAQEIAWGGSLADGATGGGFSELFTSPAWQKTKGVGAKRSVPDVAGNADPLSGYEIIDDGQAIACGGTSAVAPLMAGLACVLQSNLVSKLPPLAPFL